MPPVESVRAKQERLMEWVRLVATERGRDKSYEALPDEVLEAEIQKFDGRIQGATQEELEYRLSVGLGVESHSTDPHCVDTGRDYDPTPVYWVRFTPGSPTQKVTLPRDEFPEVYALKALSACVRDLLHKGSGGSSK